MGLAVAQSWDVLPPCRGAERTEADRFKSTAYRPTVVVRVTAVTHGVVNAE
jgi:hypothetical protein